MVRFLRDNLTLAQRLKNLGKGIRSSANANLLEDDDAQAATTTHYKRLAPLSWERVMLMGEDDNLIVYFKQNKTWLKNMWDNKPTEAGEMQHELGIAGKQQTIGGKQLLSSCYYQVCNATP